jgi:Zn ribbon nucleic-acid-binding protein
MDTPKNEAEVPTVEARMGYYRDETTGEWKENGIGIGWCRQCGAKIRSCKCSANNQEMKNPI